MRRAVGIGIIGVGRHVNTGRPAHDLQQVGIDWLRQPIEIRDEGRCAALRTSIWSAISPSALDTSECQMKRPSQKPGARLRILVDRSRNASHRPSQIVPSRKSSRIKQCGSSREGGRRTTSQSRSFPSLVMRALPSSLSRLCPLLILLSGLSLAQRGTGSAPVAPFIAGLIRAGLRDVCRLAPLRAAC